MTTFRVIDRRDIIPKRLDRYASFPGLVQTAPAPTPPGLPLCPQPPQHLLPRRRRRLHARPLRRHPLVRTRTPLPPPRPHRRHELWRPVRLRDGTILLLTRDYDASRSRTHATYIARSTDAGRTFTPPAHPPRLLPRRLGPLRRNHRTPRLHPPPRGLRPPRRRRIQQLRLPRIPRPRPLLDHPQLDRHLRLPPLPRPRPRSPPPPRTLPAPPPLRPPPRPHPHQRYLLRHLLRRPRPHLAKTHRQLPRYGRRRPRPLHRRNARRPYRGTTHDTQPPGQRPPTVKERRGRLYCFRTSSDEGAIWSEESILDDGTAWQVGSYGMGDVVESAPNRLLAVFYTSDQDQAPWIQQVISARE